MGGEDFGRLGREKPRTPIFMFRVGTVAKETMAASLRAGGPPLPSLHSSIYAPDPEPTLEAGTKAMTAAVLELMAK